MSDAPQPIEYRGNCHCGAFKFTFKTPPLKQAPTCNCSICSKIAYIWAFPVTPENFTIVKGDEDSTLKSYCFGKGTLAHKFCPTCGTSVMCRSAGGMSGINVHVDLWSLPVVMSDRAGAEPLYKVPAPVEVGDVPEGSTVYNGSCHCGAVRYTLVSPDKITQATDCDCSICSRDGALWTYPPITAVTYEGLDSLTEYTFGIGTTYHGFCKHCGVAIRERFDLPGDTTTALNVRTINGLDMSALELEKDDGKSLPPPYEV
ncbi:Mss4-like protein [Mycena capillaripes]|nr:Mss4-like protein [Mycena capillaripes]